MIKSDYDNNDKPGKLFVIVILIVLVALFFAGFGVGWLTAKA